MLWLVMVQEGLSRSTLSDAEFVEFWAIKHAYTRRNPLGPIPRTLFSDRIDRTQPRLLVYLIKTGNGKLLSAPSTVN